MLHNNVFIEHIVSYWGVKKYKTKTFREFQVLNLIIVNQRDFKNEVYMSCFIVSSGGRTEIALIRLIVAKSELKEEV